MECTGAVLCLIFNVNPLDGHISYHNTCGSRMLSTKGEFVIILTHFARIFKFNRTPKYREDSHKTILKKEISHEIKVSVVMELV